MKVDPVRDYEDSLSSAQDMAARCELAAERAQYAESAESAATAYSMAASAYADLAKAQVEVMAVEARMLPRLDASAVTAQADAAWSAKARESFTLHPFLACWKVNGDAHRLVIDAASSDEAAEQIGDYCRERYGVDSIEVTIEGLNAARINQIIEEGSK